VVPVGLRHRADGSGTSGTEIRESPQFFAAITQVREALRGRELSADAPAGAAGAL
jgi:hypothetical protein